MPEKIILKCIIPNFFVQCILWCNVGISFEDYLIDECFYVCTLLSVIYVIKVNPKAPRWSLTGDLTPSPHTQYIEVCLIYDNKRLLRQIIICFAKLTSIGFRGIREKPPSEII